MTARKSGVFGIPFACPEIHYFCNCFIIAKGCLKDPPRYIICECSLLKYGSIAVARRLGQFLHLILGQNLEPGGQFSTLSNVTLKTFS